MGEDSGTMMIENRLSYNDSAALELEESDCISQLHLVPGKTLKEGPVFKSVRENDFVRLSAIIFSGCNLNASNEEEFGMGCTGTFYEIKDRSRMVRSVRIKGYMPLHLAVIHSKIKVIKYLISKGADVNVTDENSLSPLSLAAAVQRADVVQMLLKAGADVDSQSVSGRTPLLQAVGNNNHSIVKLLLQFGADPNLADTKGTTPLLLCLVANKEEEDNLKIMHTLIQAGAIVDNPNKQGATALLHTVGIGRLDAADMLLRAGADINVRDKTGQGVLHLTSGTTTALFLLHRGATSDWPDKKGVTPLLKAARVGHITLTSFFLEADSHRSFDLLDLPRVVQAKQQVPLFDQLLQHEICSPRSLRRLCRQVVRHCLSPDNTSRIGSLPVPTMVQDFLLGKHLELTFSRPQHQHVLSSVPSVPTFHF